MCKPCTLTVLPSSFCIRSASFIGTNCECLHFHLQNYVKAMRLFVGEPVWTAYNRPADHFPAREQYQQFLAQAAQ